MRVLLAFLLFAASCAASLSGQQPGPKQPEAKKTQPKGQPKSFGPDEASLKQIEEKTERLRKAIAELKSRKVPDDVLIEVEIYLKAAENIVRFEEWLHQNSVKWTLQTIDQGLERAKLAADGKAVWREAPGKWVVRAYRSSLDQSIQPYAVLLPHDYGKDPKRKWRLDIVLHGRDGTLTEAKFLATHSSAPKGTDRDFIQLEVYGRGNNAYRWAGEADVAEATLDFEGLTRPKTNEMYRPVDTSKVILRGFSMGGAGAWHLGLHHPFRYAAVGPGAGFTTTHGYIGGLPKELPEHQEKCLRIYDAVDYAENAFNVPIVAYSGADDPQKAAADNIENALKSVKQPLRFTHLVAPGLKHQMPKEWEDKAQAAFRKIITEREQNDREHVRFVTYTTKYPHFKYGKIHALERQYEKATIEVSVHKDDFTVATANVAAFDLNLGPRNPAVVRVDGQEVDVAASRPKESLNPLFIKKNGTWTTESRSVWEGVLRKGCRQNSIALQGPIDDAFTTPFSIHAAAGAGWHQASDRFAAAEQARLIREWDKNFRGKLTPRDCDAVHLTSARNLILFGDPGSNPLIARVLPKLPITWTSDRLVVNGVEYDAATHVPMLVYPNPENPRQYLVINSGHTFRQADFDGTNALLYPRLGDWAVVKPKPTAKDPAAYELVAAGLFDENWQYSNKK
jgi:predicted esterase